jgi:UDPglucose--hexose-1-phosphate uridylyltransferase
MSELRKDPIIGRWVIISTERGRRPNNWNNGQETKRNGFCPFCYGNEDKTPPEITAVRNSGSKANAPGWQVRVVPNKFPALQIEGDLNRQGVGLYDRMSGIGAHEVIIETPEHSMSIADLDYGHFENVLMVYRERLVDLTKDTRFRYILIFKNHGRVAGASLEHTHTQLVATPIIPKRVAEELQGAERYYRYKERCVYCDIATQEIRERDRLVLENERFVVIEPFAARFPFETWILPKEHVSNYEDIDRQDYRSLAHIFKDTLVLLNSALNNPPYNFIIHTSPTNERNIAHYHCHIEIMPKLTQIAGFEWGSGFYINPTTPEDAAEFLRNLQK